MPLRGRTRKVGRWVVIVIGAAATITPMVVWHVASNDVGNLIEAACQFLVVIAVLAHILRWGAVTRWLDRVGLGRDDPPDSPAPPGTPNERKQHDPRSSPTTRTPRPRPTSRPTRNTRSIPAARIPGRPRPVAPRRTRPNPPRRTRRARARTPRPSSRRTWPRPTTGTARSAGPVASGGSAWRPRTGPPTDLGWLA